MPYSLFHSEYKVTILNIHTSFQHIRDSIQNHKARDKAGEIGLAWQEFIPSTEKRNLKL